MAILHGSWIHSTLGGSLFIWGETWRRNSAEPSQSQVNFVPSHPFSITTLELAQFLSSLQQTKSLLLPETLLTVLKDNLEQHSGKKRQRATQPKSTGNQSGEELNSPANLVQCGQQTVALPTQLMEGRLIPWYSATPLPLNTQEALYLQPWCVPGFYLSPLVTTQFLAALPLGADNSEDPYLGGDLRFWSHVARWNLDLLARSKFLPTLEQLEDGSRKTYWQPLLDSATDQARFKNFVQQMPTVCRVYQQATQSPSIVLAVDIPPPPNEILAGFLKYTIDAQVRAAIELDFMPLPDRGSEIEPILLSWLQSLGPGKTSADPLLEMATLQAETKDIERLESALDAWISPLQQSGLQQNAFRTCFYLHPPMSGQTSWSLEYFLQAVNDPDFLVDAEIIWSTPDEHLTYLGRTIERPQESLLRGLGLASRIYPLIESSLQDARPKQHHLTPFQAYEFLKSAAWRLEDSGFGVILPSSLANREGWANRLGLKVQAETPSLSPASHLGLQSLLNFKWELSIGGQTLSKAEFDHLIAQNTPLAEINGEWVELRPQDVKAAQAFFTTRKDQTGLSLEDALRLSTGDTLSLEKLPVVSFEAAGPLQELLKTLTGNQTIEPIKTPKDFRGELRPYQSRGAGWLAFLERWGLGACLADDMGLGKTIELIAFLLHLKAQDALPGPTLLVCPTSVLGNWEREVRRFAPTLKVLVHHGAQRWSLAQRSVGAASPKEIEKTSLRSSQKKVLAKAVKGKDLVITSYSLVYRDEQNLQGISWQGVVLDEAQNIKNPEAKQSQAVRRLQAKFRIALTGTPLENRLAELWSILDFLNPGYLGPRNFFQRRFAIPVERYGDTASLQTLRSLVQPFILRRLKTDRNIIQDLPEKQEMTVFCGLTPEQAELYEQVVQESLAQIEAAEGIQRRGAILATLVKLKQICNHPAQFLREAALNGHNRSSKLKRLEEMLEEALSEGDRALVFTQFAEWGKLLKRYLEEKLGREALFLYGGSSKQQREAMVDRFQQDPHGPRIFILSLKAGGVGLNLTRANHVFHFDRWWNPAVENQATDRVFRIGQTRNVQVHKFVCTGTLEERIHEQIESKKALAEQVVGAGENWLTELDTDQLRTLLLLDRNAVIEEDTHDF
jgi:SNF2 family DNA or RNA helicase